MPMLKEWSESLQHDPTLKPRQRRSRFATECVPMLTKGTTALRRLHGGRKSCQSTPRQQKMTKEGKHLPFRIEDISPTLTTLTATSEAGRRTQPSSRVV